MSDAIFNRYKIEVNRAYYISKRYETISTFALLYFDKELSAEQLALYLRVSDKFILLDENTYFIHFTFTSQENTFKASQNLILELDNYFNNQNSCIAIEALDLNNSPKMLLNKLTQTLKETRRNSFTRIEDDTILNSII